MAKLTEAQRRVLLSVKRWMVQPDVESDDAGVFVSLSDAGLVKGHGVRFALITDAGRAALTAQEPRHD